MGSSPLQPPDRDEIEVSVFGRGYGEAIAVHIGDGAWILVDSCTAPGSTKPATVEYLQSMGVDVSQAVKLVVATHWHDDHVQGISALLEECSSAKMAVSAALSREEFRQLLAAYECSIIPQESGVDEFRRVFEIVQGRKQRLWSVESPVLASLDKLLHAGQLSVSTGTVPISVHALSPSDSSVLRGVLDFAAQIPTRGERRRRIVAPSTNHSSVAVWVAIGEHKVLLGADLEKSADPTMGWSAVLNESMATSGKAAVYKVAHHGSESGHEPRVWSQLLSESPIAVLTPFVRGGACLPTTQDIQRLTSLTPEAFITARPVTSRHRWSNRVVRDFIEGATKEIHNASFGWGHVRARCSIAAERASYQVSTFGNATRLAAGPQAS